MLRGFYQLDMSTIDQQRLEELPLYKPPPSYRLGSMGNGCAGDPPGYPSYFTRCVLSNQPAGTGAGRAAIATPENHSAVVRIRGFYPDFSNPPELFQADWWEREAEAPTPENCPGHSGTPHGKFDNCRYCGGTEQRGEGPNGSPPARR